MLRLVKKYWVCMFFLSIPSCIYTYFYFTSFRYDEDLYDKRYYPVTLTEKWTKTIEYKTLSKVKYWKCFVLEINSEQIFKKFGERNYYDIFSYKYSFVRVSDFSNEQFFDEAKEKPRFSLQIYKNNSLIHNETIYMSAIHGSYNIETNGKQFYVQGILGTTQSQKSACYDFDENTHYTIILTNQYPTIEFQNVETYLAIKPVFSGK